MSQQTLRVVALCDGDESFDASTTHKNCCRLDILESDACKECTYSGFYYDSADEKIAYLEENFYMTDITRGIDCENLPYDSEFQLEQQRSARCGCVGNCNRRLVRDSRSPFDSPGAQDAVYRELYQMRWLQTSKCIVEQTLSNEIITVGALRFLT